MFPSDSAPTASFPYRIESQIGVGSMGVVYKATEVDLERVVAIKVLRQALLDEEPPSVQQELRQRFLQEARAAATLSHPGVATIFRVGEAHDLPYMVMEWLQGRDLENILVEQPRLAIGESARLLVALLETLQNAHDHGVVHRDIKPSNLILLNDGRLKVTDFGIARIQGRELVKTQAGVVLATPKFAAPEQLRGIEVDGRADLFACGILLYRVLTGRYPFEGETFLDLANAILSKNPPSIRELQPDLSPALDAVVRTALQKDRAERFQNAAEMAEQLRPFLDLAGEPASFPPSGFIPLVRPAELSDTLRLAATAYDLPSNVTLAVLRIIGTWPGKTLPRQSVKDLLEKLWEQPLHADPFSGAVEIEDRWLLIKDGTLLAAIHRKTGEHGDRIAEDLPETAVPVLHTLPAGAPTTLVALLATLLLPPKLRHDDLDSSFVNLPALAVKLQEESFEGILRLRRGEAWGLILFADGRECQALYSQGWNEVAVEESWQRWVSDVRVRASVEEINLRPATPWFRHRFRNFAFQVVPMDSSDSNNRRSTTSSSSRIRQLFQTTRANPLATGQLVLSVSPKEGKAAGESSLYRYEQAPAYHLLHWLLTDLPRFFAEREKGSAWKYLAEWIPQVREATMYHDLDRPGTRETDSFDLVTFDKNRKALHLAHRMAEISPQTFEAFVERVIAAKTARTKTGDIGGVLLAVPSFGDAVLEAYEKKVVRGSSSFFSMEESFTGYSGFVRIGTRRGFHLLLVEETADGFVPLIPAG